MTWAVIIIVIAIAAGVLGFIFSVVLAPIADRSGWVYFAVGEHTPVKIGTCRYEPTAADVQGDSPVPLLVLHAVKARDVVVTVRQIAHDLAPDYIRDGWFERDAALMYIDHLRGAC